MLFWLPTTELLIANNIKVNLFNVVNLWYFFSTSLQCMLLQFTVYAQRSFTAFHQWRHVVTIYCLLEKVDIALAMININDHENWLLVALMMDVKMWSQSVKVGGRWEVRTVARCPKYLYEPEVVLLSFWIIMGHGPRSLANPICLQQPNFKIETVGVYLPI